MSYRRILGNTFIMGGVSVGNTLLGIVRNKVLAVMLGPSGLGLMGIYNLVISLAGIVFGMGVGESGVRQIAGAVGSGDQEAVPRVIVTVRRVVLFSGIAGCVALFFFSGIVSRFTFGSGEHSFDLALISLAILFTSISSGQTALIQGMRRIKDLAKLNLLGAFLGTALSIPIIYVLGRRGIPYFLLAVAATGILSSWWFARKIRVPPKSITWRDSLAESQPLLKLGSALMGGTLLISGTQYVLRIMIVRGFGLDAAGIYQASTTLSLVYVGFILNAMLTDFYPHLSEAAGKGDTDECCSLVNKQIEVGLLLAVPGVLAILTCAPIVISAFYSSKFMLSVTILRWQILGVMLQVIAWPIGFILRAKGDGKRFFLTELFASIAHVSFAWFGLRTFGLPGAGGALFAMNLSYFVLIYAVARKHHAFRFAPDSLRLMCLSSVAVLLVFGTPFFLTRFIDLLVNVLVTLVFGGYSLMVLIRRASEEMTVGGFFSKINFLRRKAVSLF